MQREKKWFRIHLDIIASGERADGSEWQSSFKEMMLASPLYIKGKLFSNAGKAQSRNEGKTANPLFGSAAVSAV